MFDDMNLTDFIKRLLIEYTEAGEIFSLSEEDITTQVYVLLEEAKAIDISLEAGFYRYILLGLKLPEKIHNYQFYYEMKDSPNEYEKINIMDEILI